MLTKDEAVKAYDLLVRFRQLNLLQKTSENLGKVETHHILPISCGGEDVPKNRINLLAKEHFMAHVYLWIIHHEDEFHYLTMCALNMMTKGTLTGNRKELRDFILLSEEYQKAKEEYAQFASETIGEKVSGENNGAFGKHWYYDPVTLSCAMLFEEDVPKGWKQGRKLNDTVGKHISVSLKELIWISTIDNTKETKVKKDLAQELLMTGLWKYGRLPYSTNTLNSMKQKFKNVRMNRLEKIFQLINIIGKFPLTKNGTIDRKLVRLYFLVFSQNDTYHCPLCGKSNTKFVLRTKDRNLKNPNIDNYELICHDCYIASGTSGFSGYSCKGN